MASDFAASGNGSAHEAVERLAAVMGDPVKAKILAAVAESPPTAQSRSDTGEPTGVTIRQVSERVTEPRRRVRYHLNILCSQGVMVRMGKRMRGGFVEEVFALQQPLLLSRDDVSGLSFTLQQQILLQTLRLIFSDATAALQSGVCVRRPEWAAVRLPGEVDEQGWKELAEAHEQLRLQTETILANSRERLQATSAFAIRVASANLLYVAGPPQEDGNSVPHS